MILVALGANLPGPAGSPQATLEAALAALPEHGVRVLKRSRWYASAPVPASDQPDYVNGVAAVETTLEAEALLEALQAVEAGFGRRRSVPNAARAIDLDLLDYDGRIVDGERLILPHPRLQQRAFVLKPLREIAPDWRHPVTGQPVTELIAALPDPDTATPLR